MVAGILALVATVLPPNAPAATLADLEYAQHIAQRAWSPPCQHVHVHDGPLDDPSSLAVAPIGGCWVRLRLDWWKWRRETLCTVMVHEYGHLTGLDHSADPRSVMYPVLRGVDYRCATRFSH